MVVFQRGPNSPNIITDFGFDLLDPIRIGACHDKYIYTPKSKPYTETTSTGISDLGFITVPDLVDPK